MPEAGWLSFVVSNIPGALHPPLIHLARVEDSLASPTQLRAHPVLLSANLAFTHRNALCSTR